jgi:alpha-1,6-mannosyltransferase
VVGDAGVAVRGTPEAFADGVRALMKRPEHERRAAARARAEMFGWPRAVEGFLRAHGAPAPQVSRPAPPASLRPAVPVGAPARGWATRAAEAAGADDTGTPRYA